MSKRVVVGPGGGRYTKAGSRTIQGKSIHGVVSQAGVNTRGGSHTVQRSTHDRVLLRQGQTHSIRSHSIFINLQSQMLTNYLHYYFVRSWLSSGFYELYVRWQEPDCSCEWLQLGAGPHPGEVLHDWFGSAPSPSVGFSVPLDVCLTSPAGESSSL